MKLLNSGEFGVVYKGYLAEQSTDTIVAVKTLKGELMITKSILYPCYLLKAYTPVHGLTR